jgi:hypothetical protein
MIKSGACLASHLQGSRLCGNTEIKPIFQIPISRKWFLRKRRYSAGWMMVVARTMSGGSRGRLNTIEIRRRVIKLFERMKGHTT